MNGLQRSVTFLLEVDIDQMTLTEAFWETLGQHLDCNFVRDPEAEAPAELCLDSWIQTLWNNKCMFFETTKYWDNFLYSNRYRKQVGMVFFFNTYYH